MPLSLCIFLAVRLLTAVADPRMTESSGVAPSRKFPGAYWTHNDSGSGPHLYLFGSDGKVRGRITLSKVKAVDWEGLASTPDGYIYVGDIGNNNREARKLRVHRFKEPESLNRTVDAETFELQYPDKPHDSEALLVHPVSGDVYLVTKARGSDRATLIYAARAPLKPQNRMTHVATLDFPDESDLTLIVGRVTGGDISSDGRRVILCDYFRGWEYALPQGAKSFDEIWKVKPRHVDLGKRGQGEAITYRLDGRAVIATSEGQPMSVFEADRP